MKKIFLFSMFLLFLNYFSYAEVSLANIFDDNMVLQREKPVRVWGWATPGEKVQVAFAGQNVSAIADKSGAWSLFLKPMPVEKDPQTMKVKGEKNEIVFSNVLVGDVWVLGGQSNMAFGISKVFGGDIEVLSADYKNIRIMDLPIVQSGTELKDFERGERSSGPEKGYWNVCTPEKIPDFSALGYIFGKTVHQVTGIPIGLVNTSRGGSTIESWLSASKLAEMPGNAKMMAAYQQQIKSYSPEEDLKKQIEKWQMRVESRKKQGLEPEPKPTEAKNDPQKNPNSPGTCYNGFIGPIKGLAVKGVIFHHGFNNSLSNARPELYAAHFNALIEDWRKTFNDDKLPFGIIEFCACGTPQTLDNFESCTEDAASYLREGQYAAYMNNENTGYCCAYDQQVNWFHPQKKIDVGIRMSRWALAEVYGKDVVWKPAKVVRCEIIADSVIIAFDKEVKTSDDKPFAGFALAGPDRHFYPATAGYAMKGKDERGRMQYDKTTLVVKNPLVKGPVALRYAWGRSPMGNLVSDRIIPVPQFRSDRWVFPEAPYVGGPEMDKHRKALREQYKNSFNLIKERKLKEAEYMLKNKE